MIKKSKADSLSRLRYEVTLDREAEYFPICEVLALLSTAITEGELNEKLSHQLGTLARLSTEKCLSFQVFDDKVFLDLAGLQTLAHHLGVRLNAPLPKTWNESDLAQELLASTEIARYLKSLGVSDEQLEAIDFARDRHGFPLFDANTPASIVCSVLGYEHGADKAIDRWAEAYAVQKWLTLGPTLDDERRIAGESAMQLVNFQIQQHRAAQIARASGAKGGSQSRGKSKARLLPKEHEKLSWVTAIETYCKKRQGSYGLGSHLERKFPASTRRMRENVIDECKSMDGLKRYFD
jgi:hypothetical protein